VTGAHVSEAARSKYEVLRESLSGLGSLAVAFSGGVDSALLVRVAHDVLGDKTLAVTAASSTYPTAEEEAARELAAGLGVSHVVIHTEELDIEGFKENPPDRCYYCKRELFTRIRQVAEERGIANIADGSNADDLKDYRPGARAVRELGVLTPLRDAALTKADIRALSHELGLPTWDKPAYACLASRFPYGTEITPEKLERVRKAEDVLRELGFRQCRVRDHEGVARIEVEPDRVSDLAGAETAGVVSRRFKEFGFDYVTVDLEGYRTGSMNEVLPTEVSADDSG